MLDRDRMRLLTAQRWAHRLRFAFFTPIAGLQPSSALEEMQ